MDLSLLRCSRSHVSTGDASPSLASLYIDHSSYFATLLPPSSYSPRSENGRCYLSRLLTLHYVGYDRLFIYIKKHNFSRDFSVWVFIACKSRVNRVWLNLYLFSRENGPAFLRIYSLFRQWSLYPTFFMLYEPISPFSNHVYVNYVIAASESVRVHHFIQISFHDFKHRA